MAAHPPGDDVVCRAGGMNDLFYGSVTVGERGQIVIPAEARKRHGLAPGDKLLVFRHPHVHGMVLARLDDVQALLEDLRQWVDVVVEVQRAHVEPDGRSTGRRLRKGGRER